MPGLLRVLAVGRSWRSRLARGATVLALGGAWVAPTFGLCPPLALYNTTESVAPGLYLYAHDARSVAPTRGDYYYRVMNYWMQAAARRPAGSRGIGAAGASARRRGAGARSRSRAGCAARGAPEEPRGR